ncbi:Cu(I)-responsive transcriptional regulator [Rhodospirillum centenum]|uniref:HTH-type transcriptional regulator HmrR n=1 Tax=Rhodospirillum centenum (strain ATCC 51521 / SW) TaxID=414684 RepID=B6IQ19_RHOCS|nr:Cu(I)-responsive transcriptional regulator [Rhodospirillum centenum]ACI97555.1 HTH-type transcriptional regulator HmrR [Rhodospirillum centenum SW]
MRIGDAAARSGVPARTIRYYESVGLIDAAGRGENGYRDYDDTDVRTLLFISRARALGFSMKEVAGLLELWRDRARASADVRALAQQHMAEIDARIADLQSLRRTLGDLVERCQGDGRPDCPILDTLSGSRCHG